MVKIQMSQRVRINLHIDCDVSLEEMNNAIRGISNDELPIIRLQWGIMAGKADGVFD